jgi:hypothetical protein
MQFAGCLKIERSAENGIQTGARVFPDYPVQSVDQISSIKILQFLVGLLPPLQAEVFSAIFRVIKPLVTFYDTLNYV